MKEILHKYIIKVGKDKRHELLIKWIGYARPTWELASVLDNMIVLNHYKDHLREAQNFNEGGNNVKS